MSRSPFAGALLLAGLLVSGCERLTYVDDDILGCDRVRNHSIGSSTGESLSTSDCELSDGSAVDYYRFRISGERAVRVTMTSDVLDPYVVILDDRGSLVAEEDDGGSGFSELATYLRPGTYYIAATSYDYGDYGRYRLRSEYE